MKILNTWKKRAIAGALLSAAVIFNDLTGYTLFDGAQGENPICAIDPSCRGMTPGEMKIARSIYGNAIDYKKIKLWNRPGYFYLFGQGYGAFVPSPESIYLMASEFHVADLSADLKKQRILIHELAHIWQRIKGRIGYWTWLRELLRHNYNYQMTYQFQLIPGRNFDFFNHEQQAGIVESYFSIRSQLRHAAKVRPFLLNLHLRARTLTTKDLKHSCWWFNELEAVIKEPVLNGQGDTSCQTLFSAKIKFNF